MYTKPPLRALFEDEQGCLIWNELSMVRLDQRWQRAREIVFRGDVCRQNGAFAVRSQSRSQLRFAVRLDGILGWDKGCDCEDYLKKAPWGWCKHRLAAWIYSHLTEAQQQYIERMKGQQGNGDTGDQLQHEVRQPAGA